MNLKLLVAIFIIGSSSFSYAGTQLAEQTITTVSSGWGGEGIYLDTTEGLRAEGCTGKAKMLPDNLLFKENLSLILSAFHAGTKVRLYVDGCSGTNMLLKAILLNK